MVRAPAASLTACTSQPCAEVAGRDISMVTRPPNADPPPPVLTLPGGQVATALPAWPPGTVDDALTICWSRTVPHTTSTSKSKLLAVGLKPWTCQLVQVVHDDDQRAGGGQRGQQAGYPGARPTEGGAGWVRCTEGKVEGGDGIPAYALGEAVVARERAQPGGERGVRDLPLQPVGADPQHGPRLGGEPFGGRADEMRLADAGLAGDDRRHEAGGRHPPDGGQQPGKLVVPAYDVHPSHVKCCGPRTGRLRGRNGRLIACRLRAPANRASSAYAKSLNAISPSAARSGRRCA